MANWEDVVSGVWELEERGVGCVRKAREIEGVAVVELEEEEG